MNLAWAIRRMRAMPIAEIAYRIWQLLVQRLEIVRLRWGWRPSLRKRQWRDKTLFSVDDDRDIRKEWHDHFSAEMSRLDDLVKGSIELFVHKQVALGDPIDWLREPVNGIHSPAGYGKGINYRDKKKVGDVKIIWELGRQQYLVPLAIGYLVTGNATYKDTIRKYLESWIASCPFGYTIHWCSSLEVSLRIISWSLVHSLLVLAGGRRGLFELVDNPDQLRDVIFQHTWFIRHFLSLFSSANNHLIGELTGLWTVCTVFDLGETGQSWARYAGKLLEKEAEKQVYADGVDKEQAVYYHYWVLEYLLFAWLVGTRTGNAFSKQFVDRIGRMAEFLDALSPNEGDPPQIGDADDGFVCRFSVDGREDPYRDVLSVCNLLIFKDKGAELTEKAFWYSVLAGIKPKSAQPRQVHQKIAYPKIFKHGGYAILGDAATHIVFDAGPLGYTSITAHGHADALSLCLAIDGKWWLIDPGTYTYHDNADWRNYFKGTAAHNTVLVDNADQSLTGGDFLWIKHANATLSGYGRKGSLQWAEGGHDGYMRFGVNHDRHIEYDEINRTLTIADTLSGRGSHTLSWHWHLSPEVKSEWDESKTRWVMTRKESAKRLVLSGGGRDNWSVLKGSLQPMLGWYSAALGSKIPTETLRYNCTRRLPCNLTFQISLD